MTEAIIGGASEVHRALGPGLLEPAYLACLLHELELGGLTCRTEIPVPVVYKGKKLESGYRIDLVVEDTVVVELKAVEKLLPIHQAQVITYLRLTGKPVALLINFNVALLKDGLRRLTNPSVTL